MNLPLNEVEMWRDEATAWRAQYDALATAPHEIRRLRAIFARLHLLAAVIPEPYGDRIHAEVVEALGVDFLREQPGHKHATQEAEPNPPSE